MCVCRRGPQRWGSAEDLVGSSLSFWVSGVSGLEVLQGLRLWSCFAFSASSSCSHSSDQDWLIFRELHFRCPIRDIEESQYGLG